MTPTDISLTELAQRREHVLAALDGAAAVVFAGEGGPPLLGRWRPDRAFLYLTGIDNEPGAAIVFDPSAPDPDRQITLFLKARDPEREHWDGYRDPLGAALKAKTGFRHVARSGGIASALTSAARRTRRFACLHPFAVYPGPVSPDLAAFRQVAERVPGVAIEDKSTLITALRAVKSDGELTRIQTACAATTRGYHDALRSIRPGSTERAVELALTAAYQQQGCDHAYNPIVGSGYNATVLHYMDNSGPLNPGELVLIDSGAGFQGYASDVTRTYPVSGRFTDRQKYVYEAVLEAELAGIAAAKPGATMWEVDRAARAVLDKAGFPDGYAYIIGHGLGLDVHDPLPEAPLEPGMVLTIEPGLYLPDEAIGIRIEDDILITATGNIILTPDIPKTIAEIEAVLA